MPTPVSATSRRAVRPAASRLTLIVPSPPYLNAFVNRLATAWTSRVSSPETHSGSSHTRTSMGDARPLAAGSTVSTDRSTTDCSSTASWRISNLPRVMRDTSSRSSTRRRM